MNPSSSFPEDGSENMKERLFRSAMKRKWDDVIKTYKENKVSYTAKITSSGDTALHIAVFNQAAYCVEELVELVHETEGALEAQNDIGNTPLHVAAFLGNAAMCTCIAKRKPLELMGIRNKDNETPFFLAVRYGQKQAFHALNQLYKNGQGYNYSKKNDGETILHSAIAGEYFELAYYIMKRYEKLLNAVDEKGFSALHILANKPSAFKSGSQNIRGLDKLIYHCIFVDELEDDDNMPNKSVDLQYEEGRSKYPRNYHIFVTTFKLLRDIMWVLLGRKQLKQHDLENTPEHEHKAETPTATATATATASQQDEQHPNKLMNIICGRNANAERHQFQRVTEEAEGSTKRDAQGHQFERVTKEVRSTKRNAQGHEFLPKNYLTLFNFVKFISKSMFVVLGLGSKSVEKMREKKKKHIWSMQIMETLVEHASKSGEYEHNGRSPGMKQNDDGKPVPYTLGDIGAGAGAADFNKELIEEDLGEPAAESEGEKKKKKDDVQYKKKDDVQYKKKKLVEMKEMVKSLGVVKNSATLEAVVDEVFSDRKRGDYLGLDMEKKETPILIAAKRGVQEMVKRILEEFPVAIHDMNSEEKNVVLLAVEHRQPHVYKFLLEWNVTNYSIFRKTDTEGNNALHLAARLGEYKPWLIPGAALQMQWEIKWYDFVKNSMHPNFFPRYNRDNETPMDIFSQTHNNLATEGGNWLVATSQSCSVVAALIATVAFATSATVPGGVKGDNSGTPSLQDQPAFSIFAISSLVALCFSVTSVVMFLAILTSRFQEKDFGKDLPNKLLVGLTSLFVSIGTMLLSFCAGHFFVLKQKLQYAAFPMYAITCLPVTFFAVAQFPLYFDLVRATIWKVPQRSSK